MKLKINGFENEIIFNDDNVSVLVIDDAKCFRHIIEVLNEKINGMENNELFLLDNNENEVNMSKEMYMIFDLFNIEYNSKKILNKIYEVIANNIKQNENHQIENLEIKLRNYIIEEINELPFEFIMKSELEVQEILKLFNLKIDSENYTSVLERVEILINIISTLKVAEILVIPNLKMYLTEEETVELYKYSMYNNVKLLLIERADSKILRYEQVYKIDENFDESIQAI